MLIIVACVVSVSDRHSSLQLRERLATKKYSNIEGFFRVCFFINGSGFAFWSRQAHGTSVVTILLQILAELHGHVRRVSSGNNDITHLAIFFSHSIGGKWLNKEKDYNSAQDGQAFFFFWLTPEILELRGPHTASNPERTGVAPVSIVSTERWTVLSIGIQNRNAHDRTINDRRECWQWTWARL